MGLPPMRNEISEGAAWGKLTERVYVHELATPTITGPLERSQESVGCIYFARTVLLVRVSGGMLAASPRQLVGELAKARRNLEQRAPTPASQLRATVSWLEEQQREGPLNRSYSTASIIVSGEEVWSWHVGPTAPSPGRSTGYPCRAQMLECRCSTSVASRRPRFDPRTRNCATRLRPSSTSDRLRAPSVFDTRSDRTRSSSKPIVARCRLVLSPRGAGPSRNSARRTRPGDTACPVERSSSVGCRRSNFRQDGRSRRRRSTDPRVSSRM